MKILDGAVGPISTLARVQQHYRVSECRACAVLGQPRTTQRYQSVAAPDEAPLTAAIVRLACVYRRNGYRRITALLRAESWHVNHKRVERIWRREGLKVPAKQPKRGRLWLNDESCIRLRPCWRNDLIPRTGPFEVRIFSLCFGCQDEEMRMKKSRFSEQQIAFILKQADDGTSVEEVCRKAGVSQQTYYRWRKKYAGLMPSEVRRLKQLEEENSRLKRMVADHSLDKEMLQDVIRRKL